MGHARQSTAHKWLKWDNSNENFHFHSKQSSPFSIRLKTGTWCLVFHRQSTAHKLIEIRPLCMNIKGLLRTSNLHPPPGSSILVIHHPRPPAGLQVGVGQGRPPFFSLNPISGGVKGIMAIWLRSQPYFMKRIFATWLVIIDTTPAIFHGQPPFLESGEDFNHQCWVKTRWWVADHFCRWPMYK